MVSMDVKPHVSFASAVASRGAANVVQSSPTAESSVTSTGVVVVPSSPTGESSVTSTGAVVLPSSPTAESSVTSTGVVVVPGAVGSL